MSDIISMLAFISTIFFSISQIYILYLVKRNVKKGIKMTSSFSILSCLIYQVIWFFYYKIKEDKNIQWCYFVGIIFSYIWMSIYLFFYSKEMQNKNIYIFLYIFIISDLIFEIWFIEKDILENDENIKRRKNLIRIISCFFNVLMYITPGLNLFKFFKELDADYIIFPISIVGLINSFFWILYGCKSDDKDNKNFYIYSNIVGLPVCIIQLILYFIFRKSKLEVKINQEALISDRESNSTKSKKRKNKKRKKSKDKNEKKDENDDLLNII